MRRQAPLEYGDNFPVPSGSWDPTVPWRFPHHQVRLRTPSLIDQILPWLMLGVGMTLGVLWMSWRMNPPASAETTSESFPVSEKTGQVIAPSLQMPSAEPVRSPRSRPARARSSLA